MIHKARKKHHTWSDLMLRDTSTNRTELRFLNRMSRNKRVENYISDDESFGSYRQTTYFPSNFFSLFSLYMSFFYSFFSLYVLLSFVFLFSFGLYYYTLIFVKLNSIVILEFTEQSILITFIEE